jgi:hypothetical protein
MIEDVDPGVGRRSHHKPRGAHVIYSRVILQPRRVPVQHCNGISAICFYSGPQFERALNHLSRDFAE